LLKKILASPQQILWFFLLQTVATLVSKFIYRKQKTLTRVALGSSLARDRKGEPENQQSQTKSTSTDLWQLQPQMLLLLKNNCTIQVYTIR